MTLFTRCFTLLLVAAACNVGQAQIFSDRVGTAGMYTIAGDGNAGTVEDVRFGFNYGNFDIFGDSYITGAIGEAPSSTGSDAATTGIFVSANNDSQISTSLIAGLYANGVNVGAGTATENFVLRYDAFHSVTPGLDGALPPSATNYQWAGINYSPSDVPASAGAEGAYRGPFTAGLSGQTLAITGEGGAGDDYEVTIGNTTIEDDAEGFSGLAAAHIGRLYAEAGFVDEDFVTPIPGTYANASAQTPIVGSEDTFDTATAGTYQQYWVDQFGPVTDPLHFDTELNENANDFLTGGVPYNAWATHEIYYVDGVWTQVINGVPVLQVDPSAAGDGTQSVSTSGTFALGFLDGFSSFNEDPEGSNFVIYDNIELVAATAGEAPDVAEFLIANGYAPGEVGPTNPGDFNADGLVNAADYTVWRDGAGSAADLQLWKDNYGADYNAAAATAAPEPGALALLAAVAGLAARRRRGC